MGLGVSLILIAAEVFRRKKSIQADQEIVAERERGVPTLTPMSPQCSAKAGKLFPVTLTEASGSLD